MSPLVGTHIKTNTQFFSPGWTLSGPRYNVEKVPTPPTADPAGRYSDVSKYTLTDFENLPGKLSF